MRSNRLWIGVTCGVALALGGVAAVDAGTQTADAAATCPTAPTCPPNVVDSVTPSPGRADRSTPAQPFTVSIDQHVIDQRIASAGVRRSNRALKRRRWASLNSSGAIIHQSGPKSGPNSFTSKRTGTGSYEVDFKTEVANCSWTATPFRPVGSTPTALAASTAGVTNQPTKVNVFLLTFKETPLDGNVVVQVLC
jgi:hypothetical protein